MATVQLSTDGGVSWPVAVYSQPGTGDAGESVFSLREVDLGAGYAGQQVRVRFYYDHVGGSAYTQTSTNVGWLIDDIQIGAEFQKLVWTIGDPSPEAVLYLELINRSRADAVAEAIRLAAHSDPAITSVYAYYGISVENIITQYNWAIANDCMDASAQPLAFNAALQQAAELHSLDMLNNDFQGHSSSSSPPAPLQAGDSLGNRLSRVGYAGYFLAAENVHAYAQSVEYGHAGFEVDWGPLEDTGDPCYNPLFAGQGMQNPAGHRMAIHNGDLNEVGIGVINGSNQTVGPQIVTQDFGARSGVSFITGVIYDDDDGDEFYSVTNSNEHEGRAGIRIDVEGSPYYTLSTSAGAYALPVTADGTYQVTFSGSGIRTHSTSVTILNGMNVKLDHRPEDVLSTYAEFASHYDLLGGPADDDDADSVPNLIEFAIEGMDPTVADAGSGLGFVLGGDGQRRLTIAKRADVSGITYLIELSVSLTAWDSVDAFAGAVVDTDDATELTVAIDPAVLPTVFARLAVAQAP